MGTESKSSERIGTVGYNKLGSKMIIVGYENCRNIYVKFEKGKPVHTSWGAFCKGNVKNVYDRSVYGIGYLGEGNYKINCRETVQYINWNRMLRRCYSEKYHAYQPTYIGCSVSEEWHNFQNFAEWYNENYYEIVGERMCLDKDILIKGNKVYSPETCVFVPSRINGLFVKKDANRGDLPIGVGLRKNKIKLKYQAICNKGEGKTTSIGHYTTPEEAFYAYKEFKEKLIKQVADEYKSKIPIKLYNAMINYEVEIDD